MLQYLPSPATPASAVRAATIITDAATLITDAATLITDAATLMTIPTQPGDACLGRSRGPAQESV